MTARLISLANPELWDVALSRLPHGPAHTHWYNAALAAGVADKIVLFEYADGEDSAACPLTLRRYDQSIDVATPYGFGGFAIRGDCKALPDTLHGFAIEQGWVCGYIALHPLFPHPFDAADGFERGRTVYVLDLSLSEDRLLASMHETHRQEIRRDSELLSSIVVGANPISKALPVLYAQTLERTGASDTYRFSEAALNAWLSSPGCLVLGLGDPLHAVVLCLYTKDVADYFINASTNHGRKYTRILLWAAVRELKRRGVRHFNLGGGAREGDALDAFKRRFGGRSLDALLLRQVYLRERFAALCLRAGAAERSKDYFPPYRAPHNLNRLTVKVKPR